MSDGDDGATGLLRQHAAAGVVFPPLAGRDARPFREDHHPQALAQPRRALADDPLQGTDAGGAVYGDGPHGRHAPAKQRNPQQFPLQDPDLRREQQLDAQGLPDRLVLAQDDRGRPGGVFQPLEPRRDPAGDPQPPQVEAGPVRHQAKARGERRRYNRQTEDRPLKLKVNPWVFQDWLFSWYKMN